jgi:hypothetical protein
MAPIDPANTLVKVAADVAGVPGSFATIADITGYTADHGSEDPTETFVFGSDEPYLKGGTLTDDYSLDGLYNTADTNGQNVLRDSRDLGVECWIQVLHDGTNGYQQRILVTSYSDNGEREGDWILCSFTASGVAGTVTEIGGS